MGWGQKWGAGQYGLDELRQRFNLQYSPELEEQAKARGGGMYNQAGDIWGMNQAGERVFLGKASGLYGNRELIEAHARQASSGEVKHSGDNSNLSSIGDRAGALWNLWSGQGTNISPQPPAPESAAPAAPSSDPGWSGKDSGGGTDGGGNKTPYDFSDVLGMTPAEFDLEADLARINAQGNITTTIQDIISKSNKYIADIQSKTAIETAGIGAGATKYTADRQKEATTYVADREKETALGVEDIRTKGALDLQNIVNAGLKDVETIRAGAALGVEDIRAKGAIDLQSIVNAGLKDVETIRAGSAEKIAGISAGAQLGSARLNAEADKYVADVQASAQLGAARLNKEATTYVADRQKESALGVENIRTKGALDLQVIVNAGLKDVETIRGQTAKDVAKIDRDKGIYGSLISAFSF